MWILSTWKERHLDPLYHVTLGKSRWYLDPLVAAQKRRLHQELVWRWAGESHPHAILKTDVFEEAFGEDRILFDLFPDTARVVGMDIAPEYAAAAKRRAPRPDFEFAAMDVRQLAFRAASFDLVLSTSTLDHFETAAELRASLQELARVLRPGGTLVVTLDNPSNPLYYVMRWMSRCRWFPFPLGRTASREQLNAWLQQAGLEVSANEWLIHNPRMLSTALFMVLRRLPVRLADSSIRALLGLFALSGRLPTRRFTACFLAALARKPGL